ncbi:PilN domain-containing protein [Nocardioides dongxiaopingii]|uniref:PilN domain-containing protein n=1 Tax=Nocardioides sp. S-1144 TaxID=2582905 RepID=UPI00110E4762|nr:PilN domain-containing protein [Nocardioides sp. S-1144]QCW51819.1 PilN domain-containing protein [Nocardioides sp. S-1144]
MSAPTLTRSPEPTPEKRRGLGRRTTAGKAGKAGKADKAGGPVGAGRGEKGTSKPLRGRRRAQSVSASVNLLSPWVFEEMKVRSLRHRFLAAAAVVLVVIAATWGLLRMTLANAETDLRADEQAASGLQQQITELADVRTYVGNVAVRTGDVEDTMAHEIAISKVVRALDEALPEGAAYTSIVVTLPPEPLLDGAQAQGPAEGALCPGPDPFGSLVVVGCVELSGTAASRADVSELVQALAAQDILVEPFITTTTSTNDESGESGADGVEFGGSSAASEATYTNRYADLDDSEDDTGDTSDTGNDTTTTDTEDQGR